MPLAETLSKQQLREYEEIEVEGFEGYFEAGEARPLVPEGTYKVRCIKFGRGIYHKTVKIYLRFHILEPCEQEGTELFMAMNAFKTVSPGSKYYGQWVIANDNIKPKRKDRMTPLIFKDCVFNAAVRTVIPKNKYDSYYSVVDSLIDKIIDNDSSQAPYL